MLICHYDVNFLFVLALYARNNSSRKIDWRTKVREKFRKKTQEILNEKYEFYILNPKNSLSIKDYVDKHFRKLEGKIFCPSDKKDFLLLALDKLDNDEKVKNNDLIEMIEKNFLLDKYELV